MNTKRDPDVTIAAWLEDGPLTLPATTRQVVVTSIHLTPQRRKPLIRLPWRSPDMNTPFRVATAAVIGVLLLGGAYYLFGGGGGPNVGAPATPTPSPVPIASPGAVVPSPTAGELLPPGTHTTTQFEPKLTFTVPAGWSKADDSPSHLDLETSVVWGALEVCKGPRASLDGLTPVDGVGADADALTRFLAERRDLEVLSSPTPWSLDGLEGYWLDIQGEGETGPEVFLFSGNDCGRNLYNIQRARYGFLDLPDGSTLMVSINTWQSSESIIDAATSIVDTFDFDLP